MKDLQGAGLSVCFGSRIFAPAGRLLERQRPGNAARRAHSQYFSMFATSLALRLFHLSAAWRFRARSGLTSFVQIPKPLPADGFPVPLRASFLVFKKFPLLGVATNNAAPRLVLFRERIEFRVITRQQRRYEDIESVAARQAFGTQNIVVFWRRGLFAFSANLVAEDSLIALITFCRERGISLNDRARDLLAKRPVL